ncbi:hypothetical protein GLOTRDRAFT_63364 [Gloeophyllum trabeum ATCC 11539]|uniref:Uncharacterized protein n=1 Tax=Gloeophyllum trabeum (strain ATCC 11539 / FP-39264 / Madison 617) TaxID=670483 RepID=S7Q2D7_GLOTA|nr:uncharacterized protein GLOTRDRAFT_63364 [Gloeophyllum trabeum ATCC 11539]EPQ53713.1 hypothetical protein GLOTRDRAFT_63364 [Gloeophyllum trabeum ATCC 11539]
MHNTARLLEAAAALSQLLRASNIPHAFYGGIFVAVMSNNPYADDIYCIVDGGLSHPFRRVRQAVSGSSHVTTIASPWCNRLHTTYHGFIPPVEIEILPAGEAGPRRLDANTTTTIRGIPFLSITEFLRAKLKAWAIRRQEQDAQEISYVVTRYWNRVDYNRVPEDDMNNFAKCHPAVAPAWLSIKRKYGL